MNGFPRPYGFAFAFAFALVVTLALSLTAGTASAQVFNSAPDLKVYPGTSDTMTVSGAPNLIYSMQATIDITGSWMGDLRIYLLPPGVTWNGALALASVPNNPNAVGLALERGVSGSNYTNARFTSQFDPTFTPVGPISGGTPPFTNIWIPDEPAKFNALYGTNPNGVWTLVIFDVTTFDENNRFDSWSLEFVAPPDPSILVERSGTTIFPTTTDTLSVRQAPGVDNQISYTVRNIGATQQLSVTNITFDVPGATNVTSASAFPASFTVNAQQSGVTDFEIRPTDPGPFSVDVTITSTALNVPSYTFTIAGVAGANLDLQRPAGTSLGIIDDLGPQPAASLTQLTYTVVNESSVALDITDITATNPTNVTVNIPTTALTVPANSQSTFFVEVTPTDFGSFSFLLTITNNTPDKNPLQVSVIGTGALHGTYTIDADPGNNPDFADFGEAFDALEANGVASAVVFEVADGTYPSNASYQLTDINGTSAQNTVTFRPVAGARPVISGAGVPAQSFIGTSVVLLSECHFVIFEGFEINGNGIAAHGIANYTENGPSSNITIRRNIIHNTTSAGLVVYMASFGTVDDTRVENNIVYNCIGQLAGGFAYGTFFLRRARNAIVSHNTIVNKSANTATFVHELGGVALTNVANFSNNIVYANAGANAYSHDNNHPLAGNGNLWFLGQNVAFGNSNFTYGNWQSGGRDTNGLVTDPLFRDPSTDDYRISPASPARDAAVALTPAITIDIDGTARPVGSANDIGAHEFNPAGPAIFALDYRGSGVTNGDDLNIGNVGQGVGMNFTFTIRNVGGQALNLTGNPRVAVSNLDNCVVSVSTVPAAAIASGSTTDVVLEVTGTNLGPFSFDVTIPNSDATKNPFTFTVEGDVVNPEPAISVQRPAGTALTSGGNINVGTLPVGAMFTYDFTIENIGSATLNLTGTPAVAVTVNSGNPTVNVDPQPAGAVALQQTTDFSVEVTPTQTGAFSLTLTIVSDAANTPNFTVTIQGTGANMPFIDVDDTLNFGTLVAGQTVNRDVEIRNLGNQDLSVTNLSLLHPAFGIVTAVNLPLTIPANSTSIVTFRFQPSEAGTFNATLVITSNSGGVAGTSTIVAFTGTATSGSGTLKKKKGCGITPDAQGLPIGLLVFVLMIALGVIRRRVH